MTERVNKWKSLNHDLSKIIGQIDAALTAKGVRDVFLSISGGYVHKASKSLRAVNLLYENDLPEEAQALVRVLFELRLNFDCFLKMGFNNPGDACIRVMDSMMLEKVKQARASKFAGIPDELRENILKDEKVISQKYSTKELEKIKRYGFTGMPIEQRASFTGHEVAYSVVYRNFSRNIHSTDYLEGYLRHDQMRGDNYNEYIENRDVSSLYTAHFSAAGMAEYANHVFNLGYDSELNSLGERQREIKQNAESDV